jgi:hypothetical protein
VLGRKSQQPARQPLFGRGHRQTDADLVSGTQTTRQHTQQHDDGLRAGQEKRGERTAADAQRTDGFQSDNGGRTGLTVQNRQFADGRARR